MQITNIKIGARLGLAFAAICAMLIVITVLSITMLAKVNDGTVKIVNDRMPKIATANELQSDINDIAIAVRNMMLSENPADREKQFGVMMEQRREGAVHLDTLNRTLRLPRARELVVQMIDTDTLYLKRQDELVKLINNGTPEQARVFLTDTMRPVLAEYKRLIGEQFKFQTETVAIAKAEAGETYSNTRQLIIGLSVAILAASAALAYWITISITGRLAQAVTVASTVAAGDLTSQIDVEGSDEVGQLLGALKSMNTALAATVGSVRSGTETISTAASQIAAGNLDLSARTEQQASSLEETASSMEELTSTVKQNADNARQANVLAQSASEVALRGGAVVSEVVDTMASINASSRKIVDIIAVIDGIAFQTNILALNAAVEAARAGEQGRGFAVVASEVRNLAQRSAAAAKEIKMLITDSVDKVDAGGKLVDQAGLTMTEIVESITRVTDIMSEIASASMEQTLGIEQINSAISQMDEVTQQNAALVEEAAAAAASMQEQSATLEEVVSIFKLAHGARERVAPAPKPVAHRPARPAVSTAARKQVTHKASASAPASRREATVAEIDSWEEF